MEGAVVGSEGLKAKAPTSHTNFGDCEPTEIPERDYAGQTKTE